MWGTLFELELPADPTMAALRLTVSAPPTGGGGHGVVEPTEVATFEWAGAELVNSAIQHYVEAFDGAEQAEIEKGVQRKAKWEADQDLKRRSGMKLDDKPPPGCGGDDDEPVTIDTTVKPFDTPATFTMPLFITEAWSAMQEAAANERASSSRGGTASGSSRQGTAGSSRGASRGKTAPMIELQIGLREDVWEDQVVHLPPGLVACRLLSVVPKQGKGKSTSAFTGETNTFVQYYWGAEWMGRSRNAAVPEDEAAAAVATAAGGGGVDEGDSAPRSQGGEPMELNESLFIPWYVSCLILT